MSSTLQCQVMALDLHRQHQWQPNLLGYHYRCRSGWYTQTLMQAPESWFEDFGSGTLVNGSAMVTLDPTFRQTVNTITDYHVFLTPNGDCKGLYVSHKSAGSFEVRELGAGHSGVAFDYRVVAKRRGYEYARLVDVTERYEDAEKQLSVRR